MMTMKTSGAQKMSVFWQKFARWVSESIPDLPQWLEAVSTVGLKE